MCVECDRVSGVVVCRAWACVGCGRVSGVGVPAQQRACHGITCARRCLRVLCACTPRSSLRCNSLAVTAATRKPVAHEEGRLRTFYLIELTTDTGKKSFMKRYHEVCNLHGQIQAFFPDLSFTVDLRAPHLNENKRQIDVIGARKVSPGTHTPAIERCRSHPLTATPPHCNAASASTPSRRT